ncbi:MAG: CHAT domain-containing protein [Niabella sp.]
MNDKKKGKVLAHNNKLVLLLWLLLPVLFSNTAVNKDSLQKNYTKNKEQDNLAQYVDFLFDYIDTHPQTVINQDDSLMQTLWRAPATHDEKLSYYNLLINMAYHQLRYRQIPASIKWYEQAYRFYVQNKQDSSLEQEMYFEEYVGKPLGNNYTRMGDFSKALYIQQAAIQSAYEKNLFDILPGLYGNLATTYFHAQQYDSVQYYINEGLQITAPHHPQIINLYNLKAEAFLETQKKDSAVYWNHKAMTITGYFAHTNPDAIIITYLDKARILNQQKANTEAISYLRKAWKQASPQNIAEKVEIAIETGNAFLLANKTDSSIIWHQKALDFFNLNEEGLYPDFKVTTALFGVATALLYKNPDAAAVWYEKAVLNDYYTQQLLPTSINSRTAAYANSKYSEVGLALYHQLFDQTGNKEFLIKAMWLAELSKGRQLISEQLRSQQWTSDSTLEKNKTLTDELKGLYLNLAETKEPQLKEQIKNKIQALEYNLNLNENSYAHLLEAPSYNKFKSWLNKASKTNAVSSYYWGTSYIYCTHFQGTQYTHFLDTLLQKNKEAITTFTQKYFYNGPGSFNNNPADYYRQSNRLLEQWKPWYANTSTLVYVSPDGPLHALPLEALCTNPLQPTYFGEQAAIVYSFSFLQYILPQLQTSKKPAVHIFTLEQPHLGFEPLPESGVERKFLTRQFKALSLNAASTTSNEFLNTLQSGNIIHFASHAVGGQSANENYLVLKNKLYLGELQYITARCPLLVLAACETGSGVLQKGEGLQSLGRAFISKGVGGVIATRWPVDDMAGSEILKYFYNHLKKAQLPAQALQQARQEYIKTQSSVAAKNPWLWAAFVYQGLNQEVTPAPKSYWWVVLLIAGVVALTFIVRKKITNIFS